MFNREQLLAPVWDTDIVYAESLTFVDGESILMYEPSELISLYDSHLKAEYEKGVDFKLEGRKITLLSDRMFSFTTEELYPKVSVEGHTFPTGDVNLLFYEGSFFHDRQYAVTYKVKENTWAGHRPASAKALLPRTFEKLEKGEKLNMTLFGDSISVGANASQLIDAEPYLPSYSGLFVEWLSDTYGVEIDFHNPSIGGKDTGWGVDTVEENVNFRKNDLVIIALGVNDSFLPKEKYTENIRTIINAVKAKHPDTEFIIAATSYPNELYIKGAHTNHYEFTDAIDPLVGTGVAKAELGKMQAELMKHKRYIDITGNNVNHPNDFLHRMYAQYYIGMFKPE